MKMGAWGNYPKIEGAVHSFAADDDLRQLINDKSDVIPFGNGRSYGDSALAKHVISVRSHDLFLDFDAHSGLLHVQSGVLLSEILDVFVPRGWFLKVTPGTKAITIGGAIASDVHGKNHHADGCFSECVATLRIMLSNGDTVWCSKHENSQLFRATCGGMGLTGVILDARISLQKIRSCNIYQTTFKTKNLRETFDAFEANCHKRYSVAWIDCLAKSDGIGRGLLTTGDFCDESNLDYQETTRLNIPFYLPSFLMNRFSIKCFNFFYYGRVRNEISTSIASIDSFFYPLDAIANWNRIYGSAGFLQYQFVLPKESSYDGLKQCLATISDAGQGSFLAVLKLCGAANDNYLSFPMEGYSLAVDFKIQKGLLSLLDTLDDIILKYGGRIYLTKDARVSKAVFEQGYPHIESFRELRRELGMDRKFNSSQSRRVEI